MKKNYILFLLICLCSLTHGGFSQACDSLTATATGFESRCAATGSIKITAAGGSGNYKYKASGPTNTNFTSADSITGLAAGTYVVTVNDIANNCSFSLPGISVTGTYDDPRFILNKVDVSCNNGDNGSITVAGQLNGLAPFVYSIAAPSPSGVGTTNSTGHFENLSAGLYFIRLTDSCGGIQTRQVTVNNYTWSLVAYPFTKSACNEVSGEIMVTDNRGNISTASGIPGFSYGVILAPGDTVWQNSPYFNLTPFSATNFQVVARDICGNIKLGSTAVNFVPQVSNTVSISEVTCNSFTATANGVVNFINPLFCLFDSLNNEIGCNATGVFNNLSFLNNYCITVYDSCTDTTIRRCFLQGPPPLSVNSNVFISNKTCSDFSAAITGMVGLTSPEFCLYDTSNTLITCNTTGTFNNLVYGDYCITVKDGCRDTLITRCFNAFKPLPILNPITPAFNNCITFSIGVDADSVFFPQYCIYDSNGVVIECNETGIFDSIPLGDYCVTIYDSCYDTTITRCFSVGMPVINNDLSVGIRNRTCTTFTASASGPSLVNAEYCLYTAADSLISCNNSGIFNDVPYGDYCVKAHNDCPDTIMIFCFTASQLVPQVDAAVEFSDENCNSFSAFIKGQQNLTRPEFCLYDSASNLLECNSTGIFGRLLYGRYCITMADNCYDTTITRCFERYPQVMDIIAWPSKSCSFNYAFITVITNNAVYPVTATILNPDSTLFKTLTFANGPIIIDSVPGVDAGSFYSVIVQDACGKRDTTNINAIASYFTHNTVIAPKCPGATWASGSGSVAITVSTNMGTVNVGIIKKDNVSYNSPLVPNSSAGDEYTFNDLGPGTYIIRSKESICNTYFYDTVTIRPYLFPNLNNSSAYQCDLGGFSVSAIAANGVGPYSYEIIGSTPSFPAIAAPPQASTLFSINNGTGYSLVRLRALDACGNATLGDASILPLASNGIYSSDNCMWYPASLSVDALYNASYSWYKKDSLSSRDSVFIGSAHSFDIPTVSPADTGTYICYLRVNQGCINRTYNFRLSGDCHFVLPVTLKEFNGRQEQGTNILTWTTFAEEAIDLYILERKPDNGRFETMHQFGARNSAGLQQYQWQDDQPLPGNNFYRLKMLSKNGTVQYSNTLLLRNKILSFNYSIYPNPVQNKLVIKLANNGTKIYKVGIYNLMNQLTWQKIVKSAGSASLQFDRPTSLQPGMYMIRITTDNNEQVTEKLIFL